MSQIEDNGHKYSILSRTFSAASVASVEGYIYMISGHHLSFNDINSNIISIQIGSELRKYPPAPTLDGDRL